MPNDEGIDLNNGLLGVLGVSSAPLASSISLDVSKACAAVVCLHVLDVLEGDGGDKARRLPGLAALSVELVDLLEGKTLGLVDHAPDEEDADEAASTPDEEDLGTHVGIARTRVDHVRSGVSNGEVEKPVASSGHGEGLGADLEREDLSSDNPGDWAPRAGEEEDVDADKCNQSLLGRHVVNTSNGTSNGDNELADSHTDGTEEEEVAATPLLNKVETREGRGDVDARGNHSDNEGVLDARVLEERGSVVEDEVDTSKLLKRLEKATGRETLAKVATEAVEVGSLAERQLVLVVGSDLSQLLNESRVINVETAEGGKRLGSLFWVTLLDEPAGSLRKPDAAGEEDKSPGKLHGDGNAVRAAVGPVLGSIVDNGSEQETNGDGKLVASDNGTTDPLGCSLGLVKRNGGRDHTNTITSEETTSNEHGDTSSSSLENDTKAEDEVADHKAKATTEKIGSWGCSQGTKEGTSREDRDDEGGLFSSDIGLVVLGVDVTGAESITPVLHSQDTTNGTSIISARLLVMHLESRWCVLHTRTKHRQKQQTGQR